MDVAPLLQRIQQQAGEEKVVNGVTGFRDCGVQLFAILGVDLGQQGQLVRFGNDLETIEIIPGTGCVEEVAHARFFMQIGEGIKAN